MLIEKNRTCNYLGCFKDNSSAPSFSFMGNLSITSTLMTLEYCYGLCIASRYGLMGVQSRFKIIFIFLLECNCNLILVL